MEIEKGYKKTDAGVIPEDWDITQLGDIIDKDRSIRYGIVQPGKYEPQGCLMLRSQDYSKGWQGPNGMHRVNSLIEAQYKNARLSKGDQIMTVVGAGIGQVATAPNWLDGAIASRSTARIAIDKTKASSEFIRACLTSPLGKRQILDSQKEGAQPVVSCRDLANFRIPLPSLREQTAIATVLSDTDTLISSLGKLIAKKRSIKQGTVQELLKPKKGWVWKKLVEIGNIDSDNLDSNTSSDYSFKYISLEDVDFGALRSFSEIVFKNAPSRARRRIRENDILISTVRPNLKSHLLFKNKDLDWVCSTGFSVLRCKDTIANASFIFNHFFGAHISQQIDNLITGSNYPALSSKDVKKLIIPLPSSIDEQIEIATMLSNMESEINLLESKLSKYRQIKSGMMQNLLTGKIRLV